MKKREVFQFREATQTRDGAGVKLSRVFHRDGVLNLDPFLLFDTFDSQDPNDYIKGFPMHPHRGIETFTYLIEGLIIHKDSLGNLGEIGSGEYQWMNSGSGIMHDEMPQKSEHMKGFQLWINLPSDKKMSKPDYSEGNADNIPVIKKDGYTVKLLSGEFEDKAKMAHTHVASDIFHIDVEPNTSFEIKTKPDHNVSIFMFRGSGYVAGKKIPAKSIVTLTDGDSVTVASGDEPFSMFYLGGIPLNEPIAWGGSIVMNTEQELADARADLANGTFIKDNITL